MGVSVGVERLFSILEAQARADESSVRTVETQVLVASGQKNFLEDRMAVCAKLWDAKIKVRIPLPSNCEERLEWPPRLNCSTRSSQSY